MKINNQIDNDSDNLVIKKTKEIEYSELILTFSESIKLPQLRFHQNSSVEEAIKKDSDSNNIYLRGLDFHIKGYFDSAKNELLKISKKFKVLKDYENLLIKNYRKLIDKYINEEKYENAFLEILDLFKYCELLYNKSDVITYAKIIKKLNKPNNTNSFISSLNNLSREIEIYSSNIDYIISEPKPKKFSYPKRLDNNASIYDLINFSYQLHSSLPHLEFRNGKIEYKECKEVLNLSHDVYHFRESQTKNSFICSSLNLNIFVYDWKLNLLNTFDAKKYSKSQRHLRNVEISPDHSLFLFTNIDKAYLCDSNFNIVKILEVPHKTGWKKLSSKNTELLKILGLKDNPRRDEIKSAFRNLAHKLHPDKNPDDPLAANKFVQIRNAYEKLMNEKVLNAFKGEKDEDKWIKIFNDFEIKIGSFSFGIQLSFGGSGEDWIYGSGIAQDSSNIYLGCYSGKTYKINNEGFVEKIYIIPEDKKGIYGQTNPAVYIIEKNKFLHILSYWYLYILENDIIQKVIKLDKDRIYWFDDGFIKISKDHKKLYSSEIKIFNNRGDEIGKIIFRDQIKYICYESGMLLLETSKKAYLFKLNNKSFN